MFTAFTLSRSIAIVVEEISVASIRSTYGACENELEKKIGQITRLLARQY